MIDVTRALICLVTITPNFYHSDSWSDGTCYVEERREELPVRGLVAIRLRHRCGDRP